MPFTPDNVPEFEALSYAWGSAEEQLHIPVRSKSRRRKIDVTRDFEEALRYLRYEDRPRIFWIDAICVNQQDLDERSEQVKRMAGIYSNAKRVVVWLGPESDDSDTAMNLLEALDGKIEVGFDNRKIKSRAGEESHWGDINEFLPYKESEWWAVNKLLARSWFERLWIWQEIALANKESIVMCGRRFLLWEQFRAAIIGTLVRRRTPIDPAQRLYARLNLVKDLFGENKNLGILVILDFTKYTKCSDPRDRIFAVLSMLNKKTRRDLNIEPDYNSRPSELYRDVTLRYLEKYDMKILSLCDGHQVHDDLPSWVPDWSKPKLAAPLIPMFVSADTAPKFNVVNQNMLQLSGMQVATISNVNPFHFEEISKLELTVIELRRIAATCDLNSQYVTGAPMLRAFCRSVLSGRVSDTFPDDDWLPTCDTGVEALRACLEPASHNDINYNSMEITVLNIFGDACANRGFFTTHEGYIGLCPAMAEPGDLVAVLLGNDDSAMILRPRETGHFEVIGDAYCEGIMAGEALLGPFPETIQYIEVLIGGYLHHRFKDRRIGTVTSEDPRLGPLPAGWRKENADREAPEWRFVNDITGEDTWSDPRLTPEALKKRGVNIQVFDLV